MSGTKQLTVSNWSEPDGTSSLFATLTETGETRHLQGDDWAREILAVELSESVPDDVRTMWAVARGALVYGALYYPLYTLGDEQLHRVADAAVLHRYRQLDGPPAKLGRQPNLHRRLDWLVARGAISRDLVERWEAIKDIRNAASHADSPRLLMPTDALTSLHILRDEIDGLFVMGTS